MNYIHTHRWIDDLPIDPYQHRYLSHILRVGICYKSIQRMANDTGIGKSKISTLKKWAISNKYVKTVKKGDRYGLTINTELIQTPHHMGTDSPPHGDRLPTTWGQTPHHMGTDSPPHGDKDIKEDIKEDNNNLDDTETQIADLLEFWIELTKYNTKNIGNDLVSWQLSAINILNKTGWDLEKAKEALKATRTEKNTDKFTYLKLPSIESHVIARLDRQTNTPAPFSHFWDDLTQAEGAIAKIQHTETRKALRDMGIWEQIEGKRNGALMNHRNSIEKLYREKVSS